MKSRKPKNALSKRLTSESMKRYWAKKKLEAATKLAAAEALERKREAEDYRQRKAAGKLTNAELHREWEEQRKEKKRKNRKLREAEMASLDTLLALGNLFSSDPKFVAFLAKAEAKAGRPLSLEEKKAGLHYFLFGPPKKSS